MADSLVEAVNRWKARHNLPSTQEFDAWIPDAILLIDALIDLERRVEALEGERPPTTSGKSRP